MMKSYTLFTIVIFTITTLQLQAKELTPVVFLNKLNQRLVGSWPYPADFEALQKEMQNKKCNSVTCLDAFFRKFIRDKMNQPEFYALFYGEVTERMGYKSPATSRLSQMIYAGKDFQDPSAGRDFALVYRTLKENKSFDELYTSQLVTDPVYKTIDVSVNNGLFDLSSIDFKNLKMSGQQTGTYQIPLENGYTIDAAEYNLKGHPNIAGLFSTRKFLLRYWNSPLNQNRKRAAAFFRLMMCDTMTPALERESQREKELRLALGRTDEQVIVDEIKKMHVDKHATQKDCAACHMRLDPIGKTMRGMELGISAEAFRGSLRYFNSSNELTDTRVQNFYELVEKTTKTPKYLDCQTNWLIEAFIGNDLKLPIHRFSEIVSAVESRKRKIKDVIEDLLMIPEFRGLKSEGQDPPILIAAKAVLSVCTDCHNELFSMRPEQLKSRLHRISVCMDLPNDSKDPKMPPSDHWSPISTQDYITVKKWVQEGAPISDKVKLFDKKEVDQILSPEIMNGKGVKRCRE